MKLKNFFRKIFIRLRLAKNGVRFPLPCKVHGVSGGDYQGALAQSRAGDELQIVHIPLKKYPWNTYVYSIELNRLLGYLEENLARKFLSIFGSGFCLDAEIAQITGGPPEYKYFGCNIRIFNSMQMMLPYLID